MAGRVKQSGTRIIRIELKWLADDGNLAEGRTLHCARWCVWCRGWKLGLWGAAAPGARGFKVRVLRWRSGVAGALLRRIISLIGPIGPMGSMGIFVCKDRARRGGARADCDNFGDLT